MPLVLAGSAQYFHVTTTDSGGHTTIGTGSVSFTLAGTLSPTLSLAGGDAYGFTGTPGTGSVIATAPGGASARLDVGVVPMNAIQRLDAVKHGNSVDSSGTYATVDITAYAASGPVYGAACAWTASDPSVTVRNQSLGSLEQTATAATQLALGKPGSFIATCTLGTLSTTVSLAR
jgi:hypothetical protein